MPGMRSWISSSLNWWAGKWHKPGAWQDQKGCAFAGFVDKILLPSPGGSKFNREMYIFNCLAYYGFYIELFWTYLVYGRKDWAITKWHETCRSSTRNIYLLWATLKFVFNCRLR